jgi:hypothetical protein
MEEVDEHCFLFGIERSADLECLAVRVIGAERYKLNFFCRLEATGVALGARDLKVLCLVLVISDNA